MGLRRSSPGPLGLQGESEGVCFPESSSESSEESKESLLFEDAEKQLLRASLRALRASRKDSKGRSLLAISVAAGRNDVVGTLLRPLPLPVHVVPPENDKAETCSETWQAVCIELQAFVNAKGNVETSD